jgi:hypothetical protein
MKFLCLCYYDTAAFAKARPEELAKLEPACKPHDPRRSTVVPKNGKPVHSSGPYTQSTKQAGAFFIVEAKDMQDAKEVAAKHPAANFGEELGFAVEVRPCEFYEENT